MRHKIVTLTLCAIMVTVITLSGCGKDNEETSTETGVEQESSGEASSDVDLLAEGEHDASGTGNSVEADIKAALNAGKGSLESPQGIYSVEYDGEVVEGVSYVLDDGQLYILKEGSYEMTDDGITMEYAGGYEETEFEIEKTDEGYNLTADSMMVPLVYAEGTDGLAGSENFDGIYLVGGVGYKFSKDGSLIVIENSSYVIEDDTIAFGGMTEEWESKDGKMIFSSNGEVVMTLVP